ncbi:MAG: ABC transporter ATP-binding protein [Deltaproteobacteria bacterium]|jgi:multiple sugar transport system ATP-binding protein|nr:ABC transporter ATP-binding protein [Deltaproteobacteria bacterium]
MIELVKLTKEYPGAGVPAVDDLSLRVEDGETIALLGPSGCGKSSTLNMIAGLERPTSGDVRVDGRSILDVAIEKRGVGLVFQDYAVFSSMTVRRNLAFGLEVRHAPKERVREAIAKTAKLLGLEAKLDVKASRLGGSELQRVAIGRTLVAEPSLLLLDEPLSNLEAEARLAMRQELRRLRQELGLTIVYVTHDQVEALSLADRVAIMHCGRLIETEKTSVVVERPQTVLVAQFLGAPPMNVLSGFFHEISGRLALRQGGADFFLPPGRLPAEVKLGGGRHYFCGARPEDLHLTSPEKALFSGAAAGLERRGGDSVLDVVSGAVELKVVVAPSTNLDLGSPVHLTVDREQIHLFDSSGRRLPNQLTAA